jgi:hypothetical protein
MARKNQNDAADPQVEVGDQVPESTSGGPNASMPTSTARGPEGATQPEAAPAAPEDEGRAARADETVPGGMYMKGTTVKGGKHYGGFLVNAEGKVLKAFKPEEENTVKLSAADQRKFEKATGEAAE